jgi:hypothetical protein
MPRFLILIAVAASVALLALVACSDDDDGPTLSPSSSPAPSFSPTPFPNVCLPNPDPATADFQTLDEPAPSSEVTSPVSVSGQVNYFEGTYQIAIYDASGTPLIETFGTAQQPDIGVIGPFSHNVAFAVSEPTPACLWVYEQSAQDGSPVHVGQVPIVLLP